MNHDSAYNLTVEDRQELVDLLLECDRTEEFWAAIIAELRGEIGNQMKSGTVKERVNTLVLTCQKFPREIETLLGRVRYKTDRSDAWHNLAKAAFRMLCEWPAVSGDLGDRLVELIEAINPRRDALWRMYPEQSFTNGFEAILILFQRPDRSDAFRFLQTLARPEHSGEQSATLQTWLNEAAGLFGLQPVPSPSDESGGNYLMVQIQPVAGDRFKLYRWVQIKGRPRQTPHDPEQTYGFAQLAGEIEETASWVHNHFTTDFVLELFVKRGLFCHDVTQWKIRVGSDWSVLACEAPIVFRCLERLEARRTENKEQTRGLSEIEAGMEAWKRSLEQPKADGPFVSLAAWREKSAALHQSSQQAAEAMIEYVPDAAAPAAGKQDALANAVCVGLGFVPAPADDARDALSTAINRGAPVVIWFRDLPASAAVDRKAFVKLLRWQRTKITLAELRGHLWQLRKAAVLSEAAEDICRHVTMLYDDYHRVPPEAVSQPPEQQ